MLGFIWAGMIVLGIGFSIVTGETVSLTESILEGGKDTVSLCVTMLGIVPLWTGVMRIGERAGIVDFIKRIIKPVLKWLFPSVPYESRAMGYIATNFAANFLGLGWAATPSGIMAMSELKKLNGNKNYADKAMCMFLIINMSSVQLLSVNLIAYRAQFMSKNPAEVTIPIIFATFFSTLIGVIYAKICERRLER